MQCRTCHANSLIEDERERFLAEPVVAPVHYCAEHQKQTDEILLPWVMNLESLQRTTEPVWDWQFTFPEIPGDDES